MAGTAPVAQAAPAAKSRTADYTIQGFLYQFNKTLLEILKASPDAEITVEGIIEDIEVAAPTGFTAIQCKYHEAQTTFAASSVYKPLLQMMHHFYGNQGSQVSYVLFAHLPSHPPGTPSPVGKAQLEAALNSEAKELKPYTNVLRGNIDVDQFLSRFTMECGPQFDLLVDDVCSALQQAGIAQGDIDTLAYPNAINIIANLSVNHDVSARKITKSMLLTDLHTIRKTAISRWTLALRTRERLLQARRQQLKANLDKNARRRYFLVSPQGVEDFKSNIVIFISDYLDKYHCKPAHIHTPLVCLECSEADFQDIQLRLLTRGVVCETGMIGSQFIETRFFRDPMVSTGLERGRPQREFALRLNRWTDLSRDLLGRSGCHDLFIVGADDVRGIATQDVNVEILAAITLKEVSYMMGVSNVYE